MSDRREEILNAEFGGLSIKPNQAIKECARSAMDEYMRETCLQLLEFIAKNNVRTTFNVKNEPVFCYKSEWLSKEQLFENFL